MSNLLLAHRGGRVWTPVAGPYGSCSSSWVCWSSWSARWAADLRLCADCGRHPGRGARPDLGCYGHLHCRPAMGVIVLRNPGHDLYLSLGMRS